MPKIVLPRNDAMLSASKVLLVEGKDEFFFFEELLRYFMLDAQFDMQPREVGGKDKFPKEFPAFLNDPNFHKVTAYAIIRDADTNSKAALASAQNLLKKYNQPYPKAHGEIASNGIVKVGLFIMPGNGSKGMLEDLCLQVVKDHPIMPYVEDFIGNLKNITTIRLPKNESKAKLQAFLAGMPVTVANVGLAAKKGYWAFDHESFSELQSFLNRLAV